MSHILETLKYTPEHSVRRQLGKKIRKEIVYPDSDGKPMADNTRQFNWIVRIKEGLEVLFANQPDVFVAGDLLWYPAEGSNKIRVAPDAMVVFGRPKGDRGSYRQWEEDNIAPQVVFEVLSPGNTPKEMARKLKFYEQYGVDEYYQYDPDKVELKVWVRSENRLCPIEQTQGWISPMLNIRFEIIDKDLSIFRADGQKFLNFIETEAKAEKERHRAEKERLKAEKERLRAEKERLRAEEAEALSAKLRALLKKHGLSEDEMSISLRY